MNHIKNIFIRNAAYEDQIEINNRIVKRRNQDIPEGEIEFDKLRIVFTEFADSDLERLDSAFIDVDVQKKEGSTTGDFLILARGMKVRFEVK